MTERDDSARRAGESAGLSVSGAETDTQTDAAEVEAPLIVDAIRRRPTGLIHHKPEGVGGTGTTAAGFLRELDDYIAAREAAARAEAWDEAAQAVAWVLTNGPCDTAAEYLLAQNPYRIARTDGAGS